MEPVARIVQFSTPDKLLLSGLWFGPWNPQRIFIFIHGLTSSLFSRNAIVAGLTTKDTASLSFNNRGHDTVANIRKADKRRKKGYSSVTIGGAFEKFTDCVFDLQGAVNFAKSRGVKEIFLIGHSTGSQKSVYFLGKRGKQKQIKGVILLSPVSDYADSLKANGNEKITNVANYARKLVKEGSANELLPPSVWKEIISAQRFLSLNTPDSEEEIFSYTQPAIKPKTLRKINIPTLVVLGKKDEYRDRPMREIGKWFNKNCRRRNTTIKIVKGADHGFSEKEAEVVDLIKSWASLW